MIFNLLLISAISESPEGLLYKTLYRTAVIQRQGINMWKNNARRIIIGIACLTFLFMAGSAYALTATVNGWTFNGDSDQNWRTYSDGTSNNFVSTTDDYFDPSWTWKGACSAFYYPLFPNAPKDDYYYTQPTAYMWLYVLKIPDDLKNSIREQDIRVYGSLDKVPADQKDKDTQQILSTAAELFNLEEPKNNPFDYSDKDITFDDRQAHLTERENDQDSHGRIAFLLDDNTVGIIYAWVIRTTPLAGGKPYDGRAWDIIDSFTISPK